MSVQLLGDPTPPGMWQTGQEDCFGCGLFFTRTVWSLRRGLLPAVLEAVALAVHFQDVDVVGEAVQQRAGEVLRSEHLGPLVEEQVGRHQDGAPFVALAEDLEEEFRSGGGQGDRGTGGRSLTRR